MDEFEGQAFIEGASGQPPYTRPDKAWLSFDEQTDASAAPGLRSHDGDSRVWLISFIGQKTNRLGSPGYGHMGGSSALIVVNRVQSARLIATYKGYLPAAVRAD